MMRLPSHFYAMVDTAGGHEPVALARMLLDAGATMMQLRLKDFGSRDFLAVACAIATLCHERGAMLIVNDRADIAKLAGADGVHVGQEDLPLAAARQIIGKIVGVSTHTVEQALAAEKGGADYIGFGAIYTGGLKNVKNAQGLDRLRAVRAAVGIPIVAIGGDTASTVAQGLYPGSRPAPTNTATVRPPRYSANRPVLRSLRAK